MASRRNSESTNNARSATPRPGGYVKIAGYSQNNGNGKESKTTPEVEMSRSRAQLIRSIQTFYRPKGRHTASKTKQVCPRRAVSPCLPSCTSITATSSDSEDDLAVGTDSANFSVCQDGELNNILGVVISTVMVLAQGEHSCSNDHLLWTAHFLETIKDEHGRMPPNVAGILNYIKYVRLKEEKDSEEDKTEKEHEEKSKSSKDDEDKSKKKEEEKSKSSKDDEDKSKKKEDEKSKSSKDDEDKGKDEEEKTSAGDEEEEANKITEVPVENKVDDEDRFSSVSSSESTDEKKGERLKPEAKSRGADEKKKERRSPNGTGGRKKTALESGSSRKSSRVSFQDELPERKKKTDDDEPPPLVEEP